MSSHGLPSLTEHGLLSFFTPLKKKSSASDIPPTDAAGSPASDSTRPASGDKKPRQPIAKDVEGTIEGSTSELLERKEKEERIYATAASANATSAASTSGGSPQALAELDNAWADRHTSGKDKSGARRRKASVGNE